MSELITPKKIIFPGSQIDHSNLSDTNEKYFVYCSTFMAFIFNKSRLTLKNIIGESNNYYISAVSLNKSSDEDILALCYNKDILIYNLITSKFCYTIPFNEIKKMEFNKNSKLLMLNDKGELFVTKLNYTKFNYLNKVNIENNFCNCFKWYPFNNDEFAYSTNKNKIYYYSLLKNNVDNNSIIDNIKNKIFGKYVQIKDDENFQINNMEFYDLDENYKYLLVGTTNSKIYLIDLTSYEITVAFNKYGKAPIQYIFWLNNQPGSFISINENSEKYIKWNVSKSNYSLIGKLSDHNIISLAKFDKESNFFGTNQNGEFFIFNEINGKIKFIIKDSHYQSILDLKVNANDEDLFITANSDGNIRLYSIKDNYNLIHIFSTIKNLNNKGISSSQKGNTKLKGYFNIINNSSNHITSLKWSPKHKNLFASGDSLLYLRIFDMNIKKQIISYQCIIKKKFNNNLNLKTNGQDNFIIQGIDWNEYDNIILCVNIRIFLFSFSINKNEKNEYSLILINEIKVNNFVYNPQFAPNYEYIIAPSEDGNIYFYSTTNDKLGKMIDVNESPTKEIKGHKKRINNITFNNSKIILASAGEDMKIGLYDMVKSKETPMSKITHSINKFLEGQESPIIQIVFLIDETLLSGARNGTIGIWDIQKLQLKYKINGHIGDIFCISSFNKHPFLFITSGNDCSIKFWNLNYKINLEKLLQIDRKNLKEIEKIIKYYFYEEDIDKFFILLNEAKKEEYLASNYFEKCEYLKKEYSKLNNNSEKKSKINFSLKKDNKNKILDNLIKESAIIQEWELFCEFCILRNRWEDAISFAPKVSLEYWQKLIDKYEKYINSEDYIKDNLKENIDFNIQSNIDEKELISLLNSNNYKKIIDSCIKKKDFQNALILFLMQKSKKIDEIISNINNSVSYNKDNNEIINNNSLINNENNHLYDDIKMNLKNDENIRNVIAEESLIYLKEGKRIKSIFNYNYFEDKRIILKIISQANFIELGYILSGFYDSNNTELKDFNDYFLIMLYEKYNNSINDNILYLIINKLYDEDYKNIFFEKLSNQNYNLNIRKEKSEIISILKKNDSNSIQKFINMYKEECFNKLLDLFLDKDNIIKLNDDEIKAISSQLSDFIKLLLLIKIKGIELDNKIQSDLILSIMIIECLNYNYKSLICLTIEYFLTQNMFNDKNENNKKIYNFVFNFINHIQNNFKYDEIVLKYKFNSINQQKYNSISSSYINNIINFDNINKVRNIMNFNDIYKCDTKEMKYYYLENEIYPKITKINDFSSSFSNTNINSEIIKLKSGNYSSFSEYLEMSKFINIKKI